MKKTRSKKTIFIVLLIVISLIGTAVTFYSWTSEERNHRYAREGIKIRTGIEVPIDIKLVCHYRDSSFGPGAKEQFTVFEFEKEPTDWLEENKFLRSDDYENETLANKNERLFGDYFDIDQIDEKGIPKKDVPDFDRPYLFRDAGIYNHTFFYFPDNLRLIVYLPWI